jgi:hypothetical protein
MSNYECDRCGVAECDLPDGVDPEFVFERTERGTFCQGCYWGYEQSEPECCASGSCEVCNPGRGRWL